jgi:glycosyltransferase involved in cell wall biosynthesis
VDLRPAIVFPGAHKRGGVERIALENLLYLAPRYPTAFVGYELDYPPTAVPVEHRIPRRAPWARGALRPVGFRTGAAEVLPSRPGTVTVSYGVNAPPGTVFHVDSVHRAWLNAGRDIRVGGVKVPNAARYLLGRHEVLLALEWDYFRRHHPARIITVSSAVADDLARFYGVPADIVEVVPNGFDPVQFNPVRRDSTREEARSRLGIDDDTVVVLFVANELRRKGLGVLLDAVAAGRPSPIEIHVVGRTPLDDFRDQIQQLRLGDRVRYHGSTDDVGAMHAIADVLVLPTQYEAFALTVIEALASGLPVITTNVPGACDRVHDDENGLLQQDSTDAQELRSLLAEALDSDRRARWSANAPASVSDLTWSNLGARVERVLLDVV